MSRYASGDMKALSELYTEDCKLMPPGSDVVEGRAGVESVFNSVHGGGAKTVKLEIDEVGPLGSPDAVFERSHYTFYKEDGSVFDHGKFVVIWKKIDGTWFLYTDIFNSNKS
jgi:ketosteroid isomerase-like protein